MRLTVLLILFFGIALSRVFATDVPDVPLADLDAKKMDNHVVRTHGLVVDATSDEADHRFDILLLKDGPLTLPVVTPRTNGNHENLIDARISVVGKIHRLHDGQRANLGPYIGIVPDSDISVLAPASDPFAAPPLKRVYFTAPLEVLRMDRRQLVGNVLAVWGENKLLLKPTEMHGWAIRVELSNPKERPACGDMVRVSGYPESDSFRINLVHARCRKEPAPTPKAANQPSPRKFFSTQQLVKGFRGDYLNTDFYGKLVQLEGIVRALPNVDGDRQFIVEFNGRLAPVDVSSCPDVLNGIATGCRVRITGVCYIESPQLHPYQAASRVKGCMIIVREAKDLLIVAQPPWWTPFRIWLVIGLLVLAVLAILVWNAALRILVNRRGRALFREQIEIARARLKTEERTRLAVELHDAISQNLAGTSMQIDAARKLLEDDRERSVRHLDIASVTLCSCREELRNCIWELKNDALEEPDMNRAIAKTLERHIGEAQLAVRFNVSRALFSDKTTHAILSIIRELAVNAVRHGRATEIKVAGGTDGDRLLFSVRDNGCGFDVVHAASAAQGHFGLQGIRERLKRLEGTLTLESAPGKGSKATVVLHIHTGQKKEHTK